MMGDNRNQRLHDWVNLDFLRKINFDYIIASSFLMVFLLGAFKGIFVGIEFVAVLSIFLAVMLKLNTLYKNNRLDVINSIIFPTATGIFILFIFSVVNLTIESTIVLSSVWLLSVSPLAHHILKFTISKIN